MCKLRRIIQDIINSVEKDFLFTQEQIKALKNNSYKWKSDFEKQLKDYFSDFTYFSRFKSRYPDLYYELIKFQEKNYRLSEFLMHDKYIIGTVNF